MSHTLRIVLYVLLAMNALGLILMCLDKLFAKKGWRRIPESTLMLVAALGGSVGSLLGMILARHKTKHPTFFIGIPVILVLQIALAVFLYMKLKA